jgi:hypothetical protein
VSAGGKKAAESKENPHLHKLPITDTSIRCYDAKVSELNVKGTQFESRLEL